jgi:hypothetical protein
MRLSPRNGIVDDHLNRIRATEHPEAPPSKNFIRGAIILGLPLEFINYTK